MLYPNKHCFKLYKKNILLWYRRDKSISVCAVFWKILTLRSHWVLSYNQSPCRMLWSCANNSQNDFSARLISTLCCIRSHLLNPSVGLSGMRILSSWNSLLMKWARKNLYIYTSPTIHHPNITMATVFCALTIRRILRVTLNVAFVNSKNAVLWLCSSVTFLAISNVLSDGISS